MHLVTKHMNYRSKIVEVFCTWTWYVKWFVRRMCHLYCCAYLTESQMSSSNGTAAQLLFSFYNSGANTNNLTHKGLCVVTRSVTTRLQIAKVRVTVKFRATCIKLRFAYFFGNSFNSYFPVLEKTSECLFTAIITNITVIVMAAIKTLRS